MVKNYNTLKVFVINLHDDTYKRERMKKILLNFSFNYDFFEAFDGRKSDIKSFEGYNDFKRKLFLGRSLFPSELGALESNRLIYKKMVEENIEMALILEDDIFIDNNFEKYLKKILQIDYNWELIRFIENEKINHSKGRIIVKLDDKYNLKRYPKLFGGSHAYLIKKNGAKKLLKLMNNFYHHIDIIMGETWKNNLNSLICNPGLVLQDPKLNVSPKNHPRFKKKEKNIHSVYFLTRFFFKIYESLAKWIHYYLKLFPDLIAIKKTN